MRLRNGIGFALAAVILGPFVLAGCSSYGSSQSSSISCDDLFASAVQQVRNRDTAGSLGAKIDIMADSCSAQYEIITDYFSASGPRAQDSGYSCEKLAEYISLEAIALLREDGNCTDSAAAPGADALPAAPPPTDDQPGGGIGWHEAAAHAGTNQRVCGPLVGDGYSEDDAFLNLGLDYPNPGRFQIVVWDVGTLEPIPFGSTICTTGMIGLYNGVAQIELQDPAEIRIYE